ncbi:unnamed protein product [Choristocarpus tenellus]
MSTKSRGDGEIEDEAKLWRVSEDPNTGKKFFWNVVTRQSQWEKPLCLCSRAERARIARQEEQQRNFFQEMEGNIRRKLQQGLFSADVTAPAAMLPAVNLQDNSDGERERERNLTRCRNRRAHVICMFTNLLLCSSITCCSYILQSSGEREHYTIEMIETSCSGILPSSYG